MKILRYEDESGNAHYGSRQDDGTVVALAGDPFAGTLTATGATATVTKLLPPVAAPPAIIGIGLNYKKHAHESNLPVPEYPVVFFKNPGALVGAGDPIVLPRYLRSDEVDYECELALVIGKTCRNATRENALSSVLGYTCANDVSARDWQMKKGGSQWSRGKSFDSFCPLGPHIVTSDELPDPNALRIRTILNGETMQDESTGDMIFDVPSLLVFLSASTTLLPGTVILTGTPSGVGVARKPQVFLKPGDTVTIDIKGIGSLTNPVIEETLP